MVAQCSAGPVEPTVRRHLGLLITALAFLGDLHLRSGKILLEAFVAAATETPLDTSLRPPSMQEVIAAERTVWANIATLLRDEKWSLPDAVTEITVTRHMLPNILCLRGKSPLTMHLHVRLKRLAPTLRVRLRPMPRVPVKSPFLNSGLAYR